MALIRKGRVLIDEATQAANFLKYRPLYPTGLFKTIQDFFAHKGNVPKPNLVLDVGCGTGHNTKLLANHFPRVVGVDYRHAEVEKARKRTDIPPNASFHTKDELSETVKNGTVDIVVLARTMHAMEYLDHHASYPDLIPRVAAHHAVLADYTHATLPKLPSKKATELLLEFATHPLLKMHWQADTSPERCHFTHHLPVPFLQTSSIEYFSMTLETNLAWVLYYMSKLDPYADHKKHNPESLLLEEYYDKLLDHFLGEQGEKSAAEIPLTIDFPAELRLSLKPY